MKDKGRKTNPGRKKSGIENRASINENKPDGYTSAVLARIQSMPETKLIENVLAPLFRAIGFSNVDVYHGPYEGGKDLVMWRKDELGITELGVAQVKKYAPSARASDSQSFSELVNQLQVAAEEPVPHVDGSTYIPRVIYFVTPFPVKTRALSTRFEGYSSLRLRNVKIVDGPLLANLLRRYMPSLAAALCGMDFAIRDAVTKKLDNKTLLAALNYGVRKDIASFYTDLHLSVDERIRDLAASVPASDSVPITLSADDAEALRRTSACIQKRHAISIIIPSSKAADRRQPRPLERTEGVMVDCRTLHDFFQEQHSWLCTEIPILNHAENDPTRLKTALVEIQKLQMTVNDVAGSDHLMRVIRSSNRAGALDLQSKPYRLTIPLETIVSTGADIAVYGPAGAGKTTCLQMLTRHRLLAREGTSLTIFLPLALAIAEYQRSVFFDSDDTAIKKLLGAVQAFLRSENVTVSAPDLEDLFRNRITLLLLDGIDEVIASAPWIIEAVQAISGSFPKVQVVVSARSHGEYCSQIHFVGVSLLPFTINQRDKFVRGWFGEIDPQKKAEATAKHLRTHPDLAEIVRSPLLTTILCVLAECNVPLPDTEIRLYDQRMRLLLGHYDIHKQAYRLTSRTDTLELISRKLAFLLHTRVCRSLPLRNIIEAASELPEWGLSKDAVVLAVNELIHPCNILVPMGLPGDFGFGHLRFQEYLAALEINQNRSLDLLSLMFKEWWYGPLLLFSQMPGNGGELLEYAIKHDCVISAGHLLDRIIALRPPTQEQMARMKESVDIQRALGGG